VVDSLKWSPLSLVPVGFGSWRCCNALRKEEVLLGPGDANGESMVSLSRAPVPPISVSALTLWEKISRSAPSVPPWMLLRLAGLPKFGWSRLMRPSMRFRGLDRTG
jgi:hypothetical protein